MTTDLHQPIIPTPEWNAAVRTRFTRPLHNHPHLIGWFEIVRLSGDSLNTMQQRRQRGTLPFTPVAHAHNADRETQEAFYLRSDVAPWLAENVRRRVASPVGKPGVNYGTNPAPPTKRSAAWGYTTPECATETPETAPVATEAAKTTWDTTDAQSERSERAERRVA